MEGTKERFPGIRVPDINCENETAGQTDGWMYGGLRLRFGLGSGLFWERAKRAVPVVEVSPSSVAKIYSQHFLRDFRAMDATLFELPKCV